MDEHIGVVLKNYREAKGWSQSRAAKFIGISLRGYQDIEKSGVIPKAAIRDRVTALLNQSEFTVTVAHEAEPHYATITVRAEDRIAELVKDKEVLRDAIQSSLNGIRSNMEMMQDFMRVNSGTIQANQEVVMVMLRQMLDLEIRTNARVHGRSVDEVVLEVGRSVTGGRQSEGKGKSMPGDKKGRVKS